MVLDAQSVPGAVTVTVRIVVRVELALPVPLLMVLLAVDTLVEDAPDTWVDEAVDDPDLEIPVDEPLADLEIPVEEATVEVGTRDPVVDELKVAVVDGFGADGAQFKISKATVPRIVIK
jgi:hypothetical protein